MRPPPLSLSIQTPTTSPSTAPVIAHSPTNSRTFSSLQICTNNINNQHNAGPRTALHVMMDNQSPSTNYYVDGPVTILPNLLLGSEQNASDPGVLKRFGVKCVVNVAKEVMNPLLELKAECGVPLTARPVPNSVASFQLLKGEAPPQSAGLWSAMPFSPRPGQQQSSQQQHFPSTPRLPIPPTAMDFECMEPSPSPTESSFPSPAYSSLSTPSPTPSPPPATPLAIPQQEPSQPYTLPAYFKIPWTHGEPNLSNHFQQAFSYIDAAVSQNLPVLVNCQQGISRSASLVIAYVMAKKGLKFQDAYQFVKGRSPAVCPNVGFISQLVEFEMGLRETGVICGDSDGDVQMDM
ncbi:hypothetical protein HDU97_009616 [Phlyctochytrium planicorne]|nr:hypothetical protein HDU97_009616 [Phlyctochytrium planicorne]